MGEWLTCALFVDGAVCGRPAAHRYLVGVRCPDHTPARLAGRPETVPDPAATMAGLQRAAQERRRAAVAAAEARAAGRRVFRRASGPGGHYTSADVDLRKVHAAMTAAGVARRARESGGVR